VVAALVSLVLSVTAPATSLTVTYWPNGPTGAKQVRTLTCAPAGGTMSRRVTACRKLATTPLAAFRPLPADAVCTEIYGGPDEALVTGRIRGRAVWSHFSRKDGCQISRWDRVAFLFSK
jgi:hypothetical protein